LIKHFEMWDLVEEVVSSRLLVLSGRTAIALLFSCFSRIIEEL
jgi:hypothetical protein